MGEERFIIIIFLVFLSKASNFALVQSTTPTIYLMTGFIMIYHLNGISSIEFALEDFLDNSDIIIPNFDFSVLDIISLKNAHLFVINFFIQTLDVDVIPIEHLDSFHFHSLSPFDYTYIWYIYVVYLSTPNSTAIRIFRQC